LSKKELSAELARLPRSFARSSLPDAVKNAGVLENRPKTRSSPNLGKQFMPLPTV
jgi:hypothetical protein